MAAPVTHNIGAYDKRIGPNGRIQYIGRPATEAEQTAGLAERERRKKSARNTFIKSAVLGTAGTLAGGYGLAALAGGAAAAPAGFGVGAANTGTWTSAVTAPAVTAGGAGGSVAAGAAAKGGGMGLSSSQWLDVGGKAWDGMSSWWGGKSANKANEKALQIQDAASRRLEQIERDKLSYEKEQQDKVDKINERNFQIQQEERMDEARRLEQKEAQYDPYRVAKEAGYRNYMKQWYGIDVGPTVARIPRQFGVGVTPGAADSQPVASLAQQATPGSAYSIAPMLPQLEAAPLPVDPQQALGSAIQYRRAINREGDY